MAGVADKARFYLERSVPQLREWEEKSIFSKDEIRSIVQKRNDFEHRVLSPGNTPSEWSSYAQWEQSVESLRSKRCQRLKLRNLNSAHAGQTRVLSIYDRSVSKHPACGALWREYLAYMAKVKAAKRWRKTMTRALRMMPKDPEMWVVAANRFASDGDMAAARNCFMRGCRFCSSDCTLWLEYARCEMKWLERMEKKKAKGEKVVAPRPANEDDDLLLLGDSDDEDEDNDLSLPEPSKAQGSVIDKETTQELRSNPAMDGAIPMAIFDISRRQPFFKAEVAEQFYFMFASFSKLSVQPRISQHALDALDEQFPNDPSTCNCHIRQPLLGVSPYTAEFPRGLGVVLQRLGSYLETTTNKTLLEKKTIAWIDAYLQLEDLDQALRTVLEHTKEKLGEEAAVAAAA
ncbi:U3 small nucleolar RNA-associated protein 6 domain-containing protein [Trichoderma afarasin]